jgi:hypothetical protein
MARGTFKLIKANGEIIYQARVTKDRRFNFPEPLCSLLEPHQLVEITIKRIPEEEGIHK